MRIKEKFYKLIDLNSKEFKIQKFDQENLTLYRKSSGSDFEELFEFYDTNVECKKVNNSSFSIDIFPFLKSYRNSDGYECSVTCVGDKGILFTDNLGNSYIQDEYSYCGDMDTNKNALKYRFDENNNLTYYMSPDGVEHKYSYDDNGLITKYTCECENTKKYIEYFYDCKNCKTYEKETMFTDGIIMYIIERVYDNEKRQISYTEKYVKDNNSRIKAYTEYDDKNNMSETKVYKDDILIDQYITRTNDNSYGSGYKK